MTATVAEARPRLVVDACGVYDMPADVYHADPVPGGSLSSSGARALLPPSCPARFRYDTDHPRTPTRTFDLGHAAHKLVLGVGPELAPVDADDWRTKAAREARDEAHTAGHVPLLVAEHEQVQAMATALREHPIAGALLAPDRGRPEQALFAQDPRTGVWLRALLDWLPNPGGPRLIVADYKTTRSAAPADLERAVYDYGYHQQGAWYADLVRLLGLAEQVAFVLVAQEKTPPYLVTVAEPDAMALRIGRHLNRQAIDLYRRCVDTGRWPGYADDVALVGLPAWVERTYLQEIL